MYGERLAESFSTGYSSGWRKRLQKREQISLSMSYINCSSHFISWGCDEPWEWDQWSFSSAHTTMDFSWDLIHLFRKRCTTVNMLSRLVKCQAASAVCIHSFDPHNNPTKIDAWTSCGYRQRKFSDSHMEAQGCKGKSICLDSLWAWAHLAVTKT